MYGINEMKAGPGGVGPEDDDDGVDTGFELGTGLGCRWKGSRMFKNADNAWTGTLCCAWSRK